MAEVTHEIAQDGGFVEVADRCWVRRHSWFDVNVSVVGGDARAAGGRHARIGARGRAGGGARAGAARRGGRGRQHPRALRPHLRQRRLRQRRRRPGLRARDGGRADRRRRASGSSGSYDDEPDDPHRAEVAGDPDHAGRPQTFSSAKVVDLGDRQVELLHLGRGPHRRRRGRAGRRRRPGARRRPRRGVGACGHAVPGFGADCYPMEWPATLDLVISLLGTRHRRGARATGSRSAASSSSEQRDAIGVVAETIRDLASRGVAGGATLWPRPSGPTRARSSRDAVRRGYEQLPRSAQKLPLDLSGMSRVARVCPAPAREAAAESPARRRTVGRCHCDSLVWLPVSSRTPTSSARWPVGTRTRCASSTTGTPPGSLPGWPVGAPTADAVVGRAPGHVRGGLEGRPQVPRRRRGPGLAVGDRDAPAGQPAAQARHERPRWDRPWWSGDNPDLAAEEQLLLTLEYADLGPRAATDLARAAGRPAGCRARRPHHAGGRASCCGIPQGTVKTRWSRPARDCGGAGMTDPARPPWHCDESTLAAFVDGTGRPRLGRLRRDPPDDLRATAAPRRPG